MPRACGEVCRLHDKVNIGEPLPKCDSSCHINTKKLKIYASLTRENPFLCMFHFTCSYHTYRNFWKGHCNPFSLFLSLGPMFSDDLMSPVGMRCCICGFVDGCKETRVPIMVTQEHNRTLMANCNTGVCSHSLDSGQEVQFYLGVLLCLNIHV